MKINNRLGIAAASLLMLAVGGTILPTHSLAKRETPQKKVTAKWNGAVVFKEYSLQCTDEELLKLNGYKEVLDLARFYICFSGDSRYFDKKFNGIQLYFRYLKKQKSLRYDVVFDSVDMLKKNIGKSPELKVVVKDEEIASPWKEVTLSGAGSGPKITISVQGLGELIRSDKLSLVARDRKTKTIVAATTLGAGPPAGGAADPGDFIVKPTPAPRPPAP